MFYYKKLSRWQVILLTVLVLAVLIGGYIIFMIGGGNVQKHFWLMIPKGSTYKSVCDSLQKHQVLKDIGGFDFIAKVLKYPDLVKPGAYELKEGESNYELVKRLRAGAQSPVPLRFESKRTLQELAEVIDNQLEMTKEEFLNACFEDSFLKKHNLIPETLISIFIPNTYRVYWNIKPAKLLAFFIEERDKFFKRYSGALERLGMTPLQVSILASIVEAETYRDAEKKRIAGVYYNRLKKNMRLQADPTVIFALGDFSKTRVLRSDTQIDSPYNTYKHNGLPIGPINCPGIVSLEAALFPENHDFIFFCAKPDFSGYHDFSTNYQDHLKQAKAYQDALDKLKVYR